MARNNLKTLVLEVLDSRTFLSLKSQFSRKIVERNVIKIPMIAFQVGRLDSLGYCDGVVPSLSKWQVHGANHQPQPLIRVWLAGHGLGLGELLESLEVQLEQGRPAGLHLTQGPL